MTHLPSLTDEELLSWFRTTRNELTTTPLEAELAERLAAAIDGKDEHRDFRREIDDMTETIADQSDQIRALEDKLADIKNIVT
jgi:bacterioferritin (cytochrome b1)